MKVRAIKECPNNKVGDVFDLPDAAANLFIHDLKIAKPVDESNPTTENEQQPAESTEATTEFDQPARRRRRGSYNRSDMQARAV